MPALDCLSHRFSLQGCETWEGVAVSRNSVVCADYGPLFGALGEAGAMRGAQAPAPAGLSCLSIAHIDTSSEFVAGHFTRPLPPHKSKPLQTKTFRVCAGAALARTPGLKSSRRDVSPQDRPRGKKSKITTCSQSSRNTLKNQLATIRTDAKLWTGALTLPGYTEHLTHSLVKWAFTRWRKRVTARIARKDVLFASICGFYKQELQGRMALHFHLLLAGDSEELVAGAWAWMVDQWIECVLSVPGMPPELVEKSRADMFRVHHFKGTKKKRFEDANFQAIRGNFHSYFAKYLGKDEMAHAAENPIPGRWWGVFNADRLPLGVMKEIELPERVAVYSHREFVKVRQARANDAKHYAMCRKLKMIENGKPTVSRIALLECYKRFKRFGGWVSIDADVPRIFRKIIGHDSNAFLMLCKAHAEGIRLKDLVAPFKFPRPLRYAAVTLTGNAVPEMAVRILQYAGGRALRDRENCPF